MSIEQQRESYKSIIRSELTAAASKGQVEAIIGLDDISFNASSVVDARITNLEDTQFKIAYYAEITATSGQITPPAGSTILLDQWANGVDALLQGIPGGTGTRPDFEDTGIDVSSFDTSGNYTLSGALPTNPAALIYYISIPLSGFGNLDLDFVIEQVAISQNVTGLDAENILYVGKGGNDSNNGKTINTRFLTFGAAITQAISETPSSSNRFAIYCEDAGAYTENLNVPEWCGIIAPNALIQGNHTITQNSLLNSFRLVATSGVAVTKSTGTGQGSIICPKIILSNGANGVLCTSGGINYTGQDIEVENGCSIGDISTGEIRVNIQKINITGTGVGVGINAAGNLSGFIECISDNGNGIGVYVGDSGIISLVVSRIVCDTAYNVASVNATLNLTCANLVGTQLNSGTVKYISNNSGASISGGVEIGDKNSGNYSEWNENGELRAYGEATQWEDLRVAINSAEVSGSNPPVSSLFKNDGNEIPGTAFALSFQSTSQGNFDIPDIAAYDTSSDYSFEFWLRPNINTQNFIECVRKQGVFDLDFWSGDTIAINYTNLGFVSSTIGFNRGNWNHIVVTLETGSPNIVSLYINSQLAGQISSAGSPVDNTNDFQFNRQETPYDLDYIAFWSKTLSQTEINGRYASGAGVQLLGTETNLEGLWELNDGSGTNVDDKTSASNDGTISGGSEGSEWDWIGGHVGNSSPGSRGTVLRFFSPDVFNEVFFEIQMPHAWRQGTNIRPHLHFIPQIDGGVGEKIRWGLEYTWADLGDVFPNTTIIYSDTIVPNETMVANTHYLTQLPEIDGTGKTFSSMIACRLFRDAESVDDNFPGFAGLLEFDLHYQTDSLGSNEEYVKY
jgi:hypothetical protein